jgi:hypothetical protein
VIGGFFGVNGKKLQRQYKNILVLLVLGNLESMHNGLFTQKKYRNSFSY